MCTKTACDHFEAATYPRTYLGHCARPGCPNYISSCPVHTRAPGGS